MRLRGESEHRKTKKFYILGFLVVLVAVMMLFPEFTGWAVDILRLSIGINPSEKACMYFISVPENVTQDGETFFYILIENCGSVVLNRTMAVEIKNSSMDTVDTMYSSNYSLVPSREMGFNFSWTASYPLGTYFIFARDNITNETTEINSSFDIVCSLGTYKCFGNTLMFCTAPLNWSFVERCEYICVNGACVPAPPAPRQPDAGGAGAPPLRAGLTLEYPFEITVQKGTNITLFIKATNNGTANLHNVYLVLISETAGLHISGMAISVLEPNSSAVFALTIDSSEFPEGVHPVSFLVVSDEIRAKGEITVNVSYVEEIDHQRLIDYYFDLIDYLEREIRDSELKGRNMTLCRTLLSEAVDEFEAAKKLLELKLYPEFLEQIEVVRSKIVECVIALAKAKRTPSYVIVTFPDYRTILYIAAIVVGATLIALFVLKKINEWRKKRELIMPRRWGFSA